MNDKESMTTAEQILSVAEEIQRNTRGGKATSIYATTETLGNISDYLHQKEQESRREEIERILNRRQQ